MSSWFEDKGLPGFAKWRRVQYGEELEHGPKIFDFINDRELGALKGGEGEGEGGDATKKGIKTSQDALNPCNKTGK